MVIPISNDILDNFELKNHDFLVDNQYYDLVSGQQEYRLYSYLSTFFDGITILDIGTLSGRSAVSLSHNENNQVISYDITNNIHNDTHKIYSKPNITFHVKNVLDDLNEELVQRCKIVMIDIDHRGNCELDIICRLKELNFSGIIILDDTTNHPDGEIKECMKKLWDDIDDIKYDFTQYGHWSGTGIISMNYDLSFSFS
jgi:predicted O-methyltransferase YrrM